MEIVALSKSKQDRFDRFFPDGIPRWIRIYDNEGQSFDRYTVVFTGPLAEKCGGDHPYLCMSQHPFHPQGVGQHEASRTIIDAPNGWAPSIGRTCHLGLRIPFDDLPKDCRKAALQDYCDYWDLPLGNAYAATGVYAEHVSPLLESKSIVRDLAEIALKPNEETKIAVEAICNETVFPKLAAMLKARVCQELTAIGYETAQQGSPPSGNLEFEDFKTKALQVIEDRFGEDNGEETAAFLAIELIRTTGLRSVIPDPDTPLRDGQISGLHEIFNTTCQDSPTPSMGC